MTVVGLNALSTDIISKIDSQSAQSSLCGCCMCPTCQNTVSCLDINGVGQGVVLIICYIVGNMMYSSATP